LSGGLQVGSLGRSFSLSSMISRRELVIIGLSVVFWAVRVVFLVILGSEAAEGAPFSSQIILSISVRLDLRKIMVEDRPYGVILR
jgi:hypothetical protein